MRSIRNIITNRIRESNAYGMLVLLKKSEDPRSLLLKYKNQINDEVIDALITQSFVSLKDGFMDQAFFWGDLANEASNLGGSAKSFGECADWQAMLLLKVFDDQLNIEGTASVDEKKEILQSALKSATQALDIFQQAGISERIPICLGKISTIYHRMNCLVPAIRFRLLSITGFLKLANAEESIPKLFDHLYSLYWAIKTKSEIVEAAEVLLGNFVQLEDIARGRLDTERLGAFYDLFGNVQANLDHPDEAFQFGEKAVSYYEKAVARKAIYHVLARMQDYALDVVNPEKLMLYGERCVSFAPPDADPTGLATRYHLLAFSYGNGGKKVEAIGALHRAAELFTLGKDETTLAGECLLNAAILEDEEGLYEDAILDLKKAQNYGGGIFKFWKVDVMLARLLWQRQGKLGEAIWHADSAVHHAISSTNNLTLRAISLHISGQIYYRIGDHERAFDRFKSLVSAYQDQPAGCWLHFNPLFHSFEVPPSKAEAIFSAIQLAQVLGRVSEIQFYQALLSALLPEDWRPKIPEEDKDDKELEQSIYGLQVFVRAEASVFSNPEQALPLYEEAATYFQEAQDSRILGIIKRGTAIAHMILGSYILAREYVLDALDFLKANPDKAVELDCRTILGIMGIRTGNLKDAFDHLVQAVNLAESQRGTLEDIQQRQSFFQSKENFDPYIRLVWVSMWIGNVSKSLEVIEQVKSRVFADSILRSNKLPIEPQVLDHAREIMRNRDSWIAEFVRQQFRYDWEDDEAENRWTMSDRAISLSHEEESLRQHPQLQLPQSEFQSSFLSFRDIRKLCEL